MKSIYNLIEIEKQKICYLQKHTNEARWNLLSWISQNNPLSIRDKLKDGIDWFYVYFQSHETFYKVRWKAQQHIDRSAFCLFLFTQEIHIQE